MVLFKILLLVPVLVYLSEGSEDHVLNAVEIVDKVNSINNNLWKAHSYGYETITQTDIKRLLGTTLLSSKAANKYRLVTSKGNSSNEDLPKNFNWADTPRTRCPIGKIRNQAACGSCWAVSTASTLSDRVCIKSNGRKTVPLSGNYITACDKSDYGCQGGLMDRVNDFVQNTGVITGGEYESDEGCQPYSLRPCGFPYEFPCVEEFSPKCRKTKCTNDWYPTKYETKENIFKISSWHFIEMDQNVAMREIYDHGPVTAAFMVYEDFFFYKNGIYEPTSESRPAGGHAVKVVGWGEENGVNYWIVSNSWGEHWGENGFFRIKRGWNVCQFEEQLSALLPKLK